MDRIDEILAIIEEVSEQYANAEMLYEQYDRALYEQHISFRDRMILMDKRYVELANSINACNRLRNLLDELDALTE